MVVPFGVAVRRCQRGQTTTEWLMIAGVLTALVAFMLTIVPRGLGVFVRGLATGIRTIAP